MSGAKFWTPVVTLQLRPGLSSLRRFYRNLRCLRAAASRYLGKGVSKPVHNINTEIANVLKWERTRLIRLGSIYRRYQRKNPAGSHDEHPQRRHPRSQQCRHSGIYDHAGFRAVNAGQIKAGAPSHTLWKMVWAKPAERGNMYAIFAAGNMTKRGVTPKAESYPIPLGRMFPMILNVPCV